jgi:hypothetical protein
VDFIADQFVDGRRFRALTVVDIYKPSVSICSDRIGSVLITDCADSGAAEAKAAHTFWQTL